MPLPGAGAARPQDRRRAPSPRATRSSATARSSARRPRTSPRARISTPTTSAWAPHSTRLCHRHRMPPPARRCRRAASWAITAPTGTVGTRNYLGILTSVNCSGSVARFIAEAAEKDPVLAVHAQHRRRRAHRPRHRLRHVGHERGLRHPDAHAEGLCAQPELRRHPSGRPRLRGDAGARPRRPGPPAPRRQLPLHDDPGRQAAPARTIDRGAGGAARDGRGRRAGGPRARPGVEADGRPAMRRVGRLFRHHREPRAWATPPTFWCAWAAPRSCRKRPRSTAPNTF